MKNNIKLLKIIIFHIVGIFFIGCSYTPNAQNTDEAVMIENQQTFKDTLSDGTQGPAMIILPSGSFMMGSPSTEQDREDNEGPQRQITIERAFAIGKYEITVAQFSRFIESSNYKPSNMCRNVENGVWDDRAGRSFRNPGFEQQARSPVVCVSWHDAQAYTEWLSKQTGEPYRLLSEAEWEYAARAGTTLPFFFGEKAELGCDYMNVADITTKKTYPDWSTIACDDGYVSSAPVGSFLPNKFGLFDMLGNAIEWVADCYEDHYEKQAVNGTPHISSTCEKRVMRGGPWYYSAKFQRAAQRMGGFPDRHYSGLGFRVAKTL